MKDDTNEERYEYAAVLHTLVMAYDGADWDGCEPYPGLSEKAWALLIRDYGGAPIKPRPRWPIEPIGTQPPPERREK